MNAKKVYVTADGLKELKKEYEELVSVKRPNIAERIKSARELGDISENAGYDSAREEQSFVEGRIKELQEILKNVQTISASNGKDTVSIGSVVRVHIDGGEEEYHIVGEPEANPMERKISHESPLGRSLLGRKIGDKVEVEAPMGNLTYTIIGIK
ncbi:transcription elongation factor GreA [candidate division WWE3 bacterium]|nr:transcription elongation factor GreA [candidate division WWE3 bacterium]